MPPSTDGESARGGRVRAERTVRLVVFPGGFNWPIWVAQEMGWFARQGIALEVTPTPGSVFQLTGLIEGRFEVDEEHPA